MLADEFVRNIRSVGRKSHYAVIRPVLVEGYPLGARGLIFGEPAEFLGLARLPESLEVTFGVRGKEQSCELMAMKDDCCALDVKAAFGKVRKAV